MNKSDQMWVQNKQTKKLKKNNILMLNLLYSFASKNDLVLKI